MLQAAYALPAVPSLSVGHLKGRSRAALISGFFGAVWVFEALFFGHAATPLWLTIAALATVVLVGWPIFEIRSLRHLQYSETDRAMWTSVSKAYWADVAIEWIACTVAVLWLVLVRRYDLIPQCLGVIIGLHFLPLAKWFRVPLYYAVGAVMILGTLASFLLARGDARTIAACLANGFTLWAGSLFNLARVKLSPRPKMD
jgi:hypothetical protein